MPRMNHRPFLTLPFRLAALCILAAVSASAGLAQEAETIEKSYEVSERPLLVIKNVDGRTRIAAGNEPVVRVRAVKEVRRAGSEASAKKAAQEVEVKIDRIGNRIEVTAVYPKRRSWFGRPRVLVHFDVMAPTRSDIEVRSVDGPLEVSGFEGRLELGTVDGALAASDCGGRISAKTVDGSLTLLNVKGEVGARTVDGRMSIQGVLDSVQASSTDGGIQIRAQPGSGAIRDWSVRTTDGRIRIALPDGFSADLDIRTTDGRIRSDHPLQVEGTVSSKRLQGRMNGGGNRVEIRSTDGSITIERF